MQQETICIHVKTKTSIINTTEIVKNKIKNTFYVMIYIDLSTFGKL